MRHQIYRELTPQAIINTFIINISLIKQLAWRDIIGRYQGSILGLIWSFINPLIMLMVYTFVFSVVFKARWGSSQSSDSKAEFALILFSGLIIHTFFAEVLNRSPSLIVSNSNYVKKVVFPLETLPYVNITSALFHACVSIAVLLLGLVLINGTIHWTIAFLPIIFTPLILLSLGISWILASLGVYLRDMNQITSIITTILLFISPVFFPLSSIPEQYQAIVIANPLTFIIEQTREVIIWGNLPNFTGLLTYFIFAFIFAQLGIIFFQKTRNGFADVL